MNRFDAIVVGGGLAGSALAVALGRAGRRVALIEAFERKSGNAPGFDDRTLVVNAASLNILSNLGILGPEMAACPIRHIEITRAGAPGHLRLAAEDYGRDRFGDVIVARELGQAMLSALSTSGNVTEYCPARVATIVNNREAARVQLDDEQWLEAALLVGADGTNSTVRESAGINGRQHDYGQSAMIFNVLGDGLSSDTAHERFTPNGPLALLPQPAGRFGVVWVDTTERIDAAMQWSDETLIAHLQQRAGTTSVRFESPGRRARYPLLQFRTPVPVAERVAVIGNAANTVHPVSAQGFNLGLRDVAGLIDAIADSEDCGHDDCLARYVEARQADQAATVAYTDTLARAFTNPSLAARVGTALGLFAHAAFPSVSRRLVRAAMGFRDPVSTLASERRS